MIRTLGAFLLWASAAVADTGDWSGVDVAFLGERHDNPAHHRVQAETVETIRPAALVFEMLTQEQADRVTPELIADPAALEARLDWNASGWPDFAMYHPIFAAAPEARYFGAAVPRDVARRALSDGIVESFGTDAAAFGLDRALSVAEQEAREALQMAAHCDALPVEALPSMVAIQRLRDAELARSALRALDETGGPVAVVTGNGHARADWGAPALLRAAAPQTSIRTLGLGETGSGAPPGDFDVVVVTDDVERGDPCDAFRG